MIFNTEIKEIFQANYRENFVDLFAGSMEIPLNFKNEFKELDVLVNVKDEKIETPLVLEIGKGYIYTGEIETLKKYIQME